MSRSKQLVQSRNLPQNHAVVSYQNVNVNVTTVLILLPLKYSPQTEGLHATTVYADVCHFILLF